MPLILHDFLYPEGEIAVWEIEEETLALFERLELTDIERNEVTKMSLQRKKEWVAARWLIHKLSGRAQRGKCLKDEYGKPYLENSPFHISISHSVDKVAVIASPYNIGVDIQEIVEKIERLSKKFRHPEKEKWAESLLDKHILWGAKEAMYKAWGKKGIDFKEDMQVFEGKWEGASFNSKGLLRKNNITMFFEIIGKKLDGFLLMWVYEEWREIGKGNS